MITTDGKICIERSIEQFQSSTIEDVISYFDIDETCKYINDNKYTKVCLQFPDELLSECLKVYVEIKRHTNADLYILGDTSYASCCVDAVAAMHVKGEVIIHYGHTCFTKSNIPVYYVLPKANLSDRSLNLLLESLKEDSNLCLFYDAEYEHCREVREGFIQKRYPAITYTNNNLIIQESYGENEIITKSWFAKHPEAFIAFISMDDIPNKFCGRVIRNKKNEDYPVEIIEECTCVYIGSRGRTLLNFTITVKAAKWLLLDPVSNKVEIMNETMWFKRRRFLIEKCKDANNVGILICKLAGEQTKDIISRLKQLCKINGKKSYIVSVGKPNVAKLANFPEIDIYVMVACPENDLYDNRDFYRPIIYPFELEVALNSNRKSFNSYHITDYDELLPGRKHYCDINHIKETTDVSLITGKIRETKVETCEEGNMEITEAPKWTLQSIGNNLQERSWKGLEQKLGETDVKKAEDGRKGIPLRYKNEPE